MQRLYVVGLILLLLGMGTACGGGDNSGDNEVVCTQEARASVVVTVVNSMGAPLPGARVTYRVAGGESQSALCADPGMFLGACTVFIAGFEVAGDVTVQAQHDGFAPSLATVRIDKDEEGCHVRTRNLTLTLVPL